MRQQKRWVIVLMCIAVALCMGACKQPEDQKQDNAAAESSITETKETTAEKKVDTAQKESTTKETSKKTKQTTQTAAAETTKAAAAKKSQSEKKAAKETKKKKKTSTAQKSEKPSGHVLTIKGGNGDIYFTEKELSKMGTASYKYSYRNKESSHRQFLTVTGVPLTKIISKSGASGSTILFRSKDGYTKQFSVSELSSSKKAFLKTTGSSAKNVPAVITTKGSDAFRLCFGQSADDTDENGDYNAQYWVKDIDYIQIK